MFFSQTETDFFAYPYPNINYKTNVNKNRENGLTQITYDSGGDTR